MFSTKYAGNILLSWSQAGVQNTVGKCNMMDPRNSPSNLSGEPCLRICEKGMPKAWWKSEHLGAVEPAMSVCSGVLQINQCIGHRCHNNRFYYMRSSSSSSSSVLSSLLNHYCQLSLLLQKAAWCGAISPVNHVCNHYAFCFWESWEKQ